MVDGLGVNSRVLMIGAHPDDEDTFLLTWLSRGRHVTAAYLSLTRGDGGQNIIGNELGEALGVIRTEELLAARRVDGALQYFSRAFDFGFSKDTADTFAHWQRDSILGDVVRVVRAFRPHVIVAVFTGTPRDGHGHHQVSGILARVAYDAAGDTVRFPVRDYGAAWTPAKFYRAARFRPESGTLAMNVGEFSPLLGESYGEIAGRSRSQHKSQAFGTLEPKGTIIDHVRREASRVNAATAAESEHSIFDGIDTTWARLRPAVTNNAGRAALDSLPGAFAAARGAFDPFQPSRLIPTLLRINGLLESVARATGSESLDAMTSVYEAQRRVQQALRLASGVEVDAIAPREAVTAGKPFPVEVTVYNRGSDTVALVGPLTSATQGTSSPRLLAPGGALRDSLTLTLDSVTQPWWLEQGRAGSMFAAPGSSVPANRRGSQAAVAYRIAIGNTPVTTTGTSVVFRYADEIRGEVRRDVAAVPAVSLTLAQAVTYAPASAPIDRDITVRLRSSDTASRDVRVHLSLPAGLVPDSTTRTVRLPSYGTERTVSFHIRGRLAPGEHRISAVAESGGETYSTGYQLIDYDHIRRQRIYRPAVTTVHAVDLRVPERLRVAYVPGVSDNVAPVLAQLGVPVTVIPAAELARADLSRYSTVVVGPRAYDAHPELVAANPRLLDFARGGGTLLVQYGQYEMTQPGIMPYPITIARPHDRVTHEDVPVTVLDANATVLNAPNRIGAQDYEGWVQERSLYMPRTFDEHYGSVLAMNDPGEPPNRGAILITPLGRGTYVYTTLAFFRELPAGVPGAARLFVNLLSAGLAPSSPVP